MKKPRGKRLNILLTVAAGALVVATAESQRVVITNSGTAGSSLASQPLVTWPDDFEYEGAFRLPVSTSGGYDYDNVKVGGLDYNAATGGLFVTGLDDGFAACEINVPALVEDANPNNWNLATFTQGCVDPTEGQQTADFGDTTNVSNPRLNGILLHDGDLYFSFYEYFLNSNPESHFRFTGASDLDTGNYEGTFRLGSSGTNVPNSGWLATTMGHIPSDWQTSMGGNAYTAGGGIPIISRQCNGHCIYAVDLDDLHTGTTEPVVVDRLVAHTSTSGQSYGGCTWSGTSSDCGYSTGALGGYLSYAVQEWNGTSIWNGLVHFNGTRTVMIFGMHGQGYFCYGTPVNSEYPTAQPCPSDTGIAAHGTHSTDAWTADPTPAFPSNAAYEYKIWAYDALDLAAVKAGTMNYWAPIPYHVAEPTFINGAPSAGSRYLIGATYDPATRRLFLVQSFVHGFLNGFPGVHVYTCTGCPS